MEITKDFLKVAVGIESEAGMETEINIQNIQSTSPFVLNAGELVI